MPHLYIANPSKQDHDFVFVLAERTKRQPERRMIPAGSQIVVRNLSQPDLDAIVEHHRIYGMREAKEALRGKTFANLIYSTDKEIKLDGISSAIEHNMVVLDRVGNELRQAAALAADQSVQMSGPETSVLKATDVEVVELEQKGGGDTKINQKIKVEPKPGEIDRRGGRSSVGAVV